MIGGYMMDFEQMIFILIMAITTTTIAVITSHMKIAREIYNFLDEHKEAVMVLIKELREDLSKTKDSK